VRNMVIESPCIRNCCLDDDDICHGCFRHLEEIKQWTLVDDKGKQKILEKTKIRKQARINTLEKLGLDTTWL